MEPQRRILVAVNPVVLEGAMAKLLESPSVEVIQYHEADRLDLAEPCDAAIVTIELPDEMRPDVVITLPDTVGPSGHGRLTVGQESREVDITSFQDLRTLLHEHLPE